LPAGIAGAAAARAGREALVGSLLRFRRDDHL
jgi:hypothetical protein